MSLIRESGVGAAGGGGSSITGELLVNSSHTAASPLSLLVNMTQTTVVTQSVINNLVLDDIVTINTKYIMDNISSNQCVYLAVQDAVTAEKLSYGMSVTSKVANVNVGDTNMSFVVGADAVSNGVNVVIHGFKGSTSTKLYDFTHTLVKYEG